MKYHWQKDTSKLSDVKTWKMGKVARQPGPKHIKSAHFSPYSPLPPWSMVPSPHFWGYSLLIVASLIFLRPQFVPTFHSEWSFQNENLIIAPKTLHNFIPAISSVSPHTNSILLFIPLIRFLTYAQLFLLPRILSNLLPSVLSLTLSYRFQYKLLFPRKMRCDPVIVNQQLLFQTYTLFSAFTALISSFHYVFISVFTCMSVSFTELWAPFP